jgi:hypothetical protein
MCLGLGTTNLTLYKRLMMTAEGLKNRIPKISSSKLYRMEELRALRNPFYSLHTGGIILRELKKL